MTINLISATELKAAAEEHRIEQVSVKLQKVLGRCNDALNAKVTAFRRNKGLNDIAMLVNVQYMRDEHDVIDDVMDQLKAAGYTVRKSEGDSRDETTYWINIAVT